MADQFDSLAPRDILITLRSLERRIDGVVGQVRSDPDLFAQIDSLNSSGSSFADIVSDGATRLSILSEALATAARATRKIGKGDFEPAPRSSRLSIEDAQDQIGTSASSLADSLEKLAADDWSAAVAVNGEGDLSVVDLAREVARRGVNTLRDLQTRLDQIS
jgi:hypothetical protein